MHRLRVSFTQYKVRVGGVTRKSLLIAEEDNRKGTTVKRKKKKKTHKESPFLF